MFDKRLMKLCPKGGRYIICIVLLDWLELWCNAAMIMMIAVLIERFYYRRWNKLDLVSFAGMITIILIIRFITARYTAAMRYLATRAVKKKLRELIYNKLLKLGTRYQEHVATAELVQESVEGVDQLETYFGQYIPQFFYSFLAPFTLFFLFGFAGSFKAASVLLICVPLIPISIIIVQKFAKKVLAKYWAQYTQLGSAFLENLQGMTTLKIYRADAFKNKQMNKESEHFRLITMKVLNMQLNSIIIMDFFAYGGASLGIALACRAFTSGSLRLHNCIFMILLSADFFLPMRRLGSYFHVAMNALSASDRIFNFLGLKEPPENSGIITDNYDIQMRLVCFSFNKSCEILGRNREILKDVSLSVPENSFVGIVGESGSGKSTVSSLLTGKNKADSGYITIGKKDISGISEASLATNITYIGHASGLFKGTVRENLLFGRPEASDTDLWDALSECELSEFLKEENGLDTYLFENAANLSGGQRQRLALARALLHDSPIYIFDEATSNIDVESEQVILSRILTMKGRKTIIMISHRLANTVGADCIYVMEKGNIVESGQHEELLNINGTYAHLWKTQSELENFRSEAAL